MVKVNYRAVHTKSMWRKVSTHQSLESAINGKDGAAGLFARKARINFETHGDPCYVQVLSTAHGPQLGPAEVQPGNARGVGNTGRDRRLCN